MTFKFIIQPPYSLMIGGEAMINPKTRIVDGFCVHLLLISLDISWADDNDFYNLT
tara:strand:+ start:1835 stop:1999 length:165 start_codon:yes stop_codon:yes gene_type:complete